MVSKNAEPLFDNSFSDDVVTQEDIRKEKLARDMATGARYAYWVGVVLLGSFLVGLITAAPPRVLDPTWQLNLIGLLLASGTLPLIGALLICLSRLIDPSDRRLQKHAQWVRTLAPWVALGWLLLVPLQLYTGVRLINSQGSNELGQIQSLQRIANEVRDAKSEFELRKAMAQVPNQAPLPPLAVPLPVAKANLLAQFQKTINTLKNNQEQGSANRLQIWLKEAFRNCLQSLLLGLGYLAIGKDRLLESFLTRQPLRGLRRRTR
jgi:hypothetical protein